MLRIDIIFDAIGLYIVRSAEVFDKCADASFTIFTTQMLVYAFLLVIGEDRTSFDELEE